MKKLREKTIINIKKTKFFIPLNLPHIDNVFFKKDLKLIVNRTLCLYTIVGVSCTGSNELRDKCAIWLKNQNIYSFLSKKEIEFFKKNKLKTPKYCNMEESLFVLLWITGFVNDILLETNIPPNMINYFPSINTGNIKLFSNKANIRDKNDILEMLDYYYVLDNMLYNLKFNNNKKYSSKAHLKINLRRMALEWVLSENDWDNIYMDS